MNNAWMEIDAVPPDARATPRIWERVALDESAPLLLSRDGPELTLGARRHGEVLLDVTRGGDKWFLRPRMNDCYRNGVVLGSGERYSLENGDRIEAMRGLWLRFLDDTVALRLPRLRQLGSHAFLFAPTPLDGAARWRALTRARDELLTAVRLYESADEDGLVAAFAPSIVRLLGTPCGMFALLRDAAGVSLAALLERTREQEATLDEACIEAIGRDVYGARERALAGGWRPMQVVEDDVVVTWEGRALWVPFARPRSAPPGQAFIPRRDPFAPPPFGTATDADDVAGGAARALAGVVARLFSEEHAAEMALREEVALWTRDGLADLERATRGRPAP